MPPPALPAGLPSGYRITPVTGADAADIFTLVCDCDIAVLGYPDWSMQDVEADIAPLGGGKERAQALVRDTGSGRLLCWWVTDPREGASRFTSDVYVDPTLGDEGDALALAGWEAIAEWAREWSAGTGLAESFIEVGSLQGDTAVERRLAAAGFAQVRTFWRMTGDVPETTPPAPMVPGLSIVPCEDTHLMHELIEASFVDHWGHEPETHDDWLERWRSRPGFDLTLWWLALVDGVPAGLLVASHQMAGDDALYVAKLGTLPAYRRRGVAAALLHHAFEAARAEGYAHVRLGVDSESPTGAPSVYRRAGFDVLFAMNAWEKPVG